ncbi:MAG: hypothetical protein NTY19_32455 [Planctomycetota bacterium]|nr:hypothetical protein [Planctomycetota bacterium]
MGYNFAQPSPGVITSGGSAPGCIGSSNGGECFQGVLDELRIYADALTADDIARLYDNGLQAVAQMTETVAAGEPQIDPPLIAHWTFNERGGAAIMRDSAGTPPLEIAAQGIRRNPSHRRLAPCRSQPKPPAASALPLTTHNLPEGQNLHDVPQPSRRAEPETRRLRHAGDLA